MVAFGAWSSGDWASSGAFWPELATVGAGLGTGQCRWLICWAGCLIEVDPGGPFRAGPGEARWRATRAAYWISRVAWGELGGARKDNHTQTAALQRGWSEQTAKPGKGIPYELSSSAAQD
jgi:hypothetical protein